MSMLAALNSGALLQTFGRLHVLTVHFPIALLLLAALIELWGVIRRRPTASPSATTCLVFGVLAAMVAVWMGLILKEESSFAGDAAKILTRHQWLGISTAIFALLTLVLRLVAPAKVYRFALLASAMLVGITGHFGGELTYGSDYLTELLTAPAKEPVATQAVPTPSNSDIKLISLDKVHFPADGKVDFIRDVRPILANACYECHGADKKRGALRLDMKSSVLRGGNSGPTLLVGKSHDSILIKRVLGMGKEKRMPENKPPLTDEQVKILATWIDQGANWPDSASAKEEKHWAFQKPVRPNLPEVKDKDWCKTPIDYFILARLEKEGLHPSPEADRATLIRRVSLDLTGIPPTPEEVDAFVNDSHPQAYERLVDRLMASPHYGERWARHWLDIARYADTNGYEKDRVRSIWPYRDWVINAINNDLPYDQFVIQQIAGDMLPGATLEDKIATGFHRNTMFNEEGGIDAEEFRFKALVDRVQTTSTAFLGLTLHCAQCHNHKYDPFTQKEYYQLMAFFNNSDEPTMDVPTPEIALKREELQKQIDAIQANLENKFPYYENTTAWIDLKATKLTSKNGAKLNTSEDGSIRATGKSPDTDTYTLEFPLTDVSATFVKLDVIATGKMGPGRTAQGNFVLSEFKAQTLDKDGKATPIALTNARADFSQQEYPVGNAIDGKPDTGWAIAKGTTQAHQSHNATFDFKDKLPASATKLVLTLDQNFGKKFTLAHFKVSLGKVAPPPATTQPIDVVRKEFFDTKLAQWEAENTPKSSHWTILDPSKFSREHEGSITKLDDHSLLFTGDNYYREQYNIELPTTQKNITAIRLEALPHPELENGGPGRTIYENDGGFLLSEFGVSTRSASATATTTPATQPAFQIASATADVSPDTVARAFDGQKNTHWTVRNLRGKPATAVFVLKQPITNESGATLCITIDSNYHQSENIGRLRLSVTSDPDPKATGLSAEVEAILLTPQAQRTPAQLATLKKHFMEVTPLLQGERDKIAALRQQMPAFITTLVMKERDVPRTQRIHHRGEYLQEREPVEPGVPAVLPPLPKGEPVNRLTFAKWLVDPENPLIGRVTMNRQWLRFFGRGIVETVDDFGTMGDKPTHPELLDWMATELIRQHWSMKAMHKMIVMSATYRQSSQVTPELEKRDPQNVLFARAPRLRVDAEIVRDVALTAAGLLNDKVGGPSVFPPQPPGVEQLSYGPLAWNTSMGPDRYRRGLYTFLKRTSLYPQITTFDGPTADLTCTRRARSDSPLQALMTLNDTVFLESAQALAKRVIMASPNDAARATLLFRLCTCRTPEPTEVKQVEDFVQKELRKYEAKPKDAAEMAGVDAKKVDAPVYAAWTTASRAILNLDESLTKE